MIIQTIRFGPEQAQVTFIGDDADPLTPPNAMNVQRCAQPGQIAQLERLAAELLVTSVGGEEPPVLPGLSRRHMEVLMLRTSGKRISEISQDLHLSESTVKNHVQDLHKRLGVHNSAGLVMAAVRLGLLGGQQEESASP